MKFFNTAGPVNCDIQYCLPPLTRFDLEEMEILIEQQKYFILHAPRQTGKIANRLYQEIIPSSALRIVLAISTNVTGFMRYNTFIFSDFSSSNRLVYPVQIIIGIS